VGDAAVVTGKYSTYPTTVAGKPRFAIQEGDAPALADPLFPTQEAADQFAAQMKRRDESNAASRAKAAETKTAAAEVESKRVAPLNAYLDSGDMTPMQKGKLKSALDQPVARRNSTTGKEYAGTRHEVVRAMVADGFVAKINEVQAIKDPKRSTFNRMDNREQEAFARRQKEAGVKTEYTLALPDGTDFVVTKAEHDYAKYVAENPQAQTTPVQGQTETPQPVGAEAPAPVQDKTEGVPAKREIPEIDLVNFRKLLSDLTYAQAIARKLKTALYGVSVDVTYEVTETGDTATKTQSAHSLATELRRERELYRALRECLGK
jgi:hypothetical protein